MDGLMARSAGEVATRTPMVTRPDTLLTEALGLMNMSKRTVLLVVEQDHKLVGLLHIHDALLLSMLQLAWSDFDVPP